MGPSGRVGSPSPMAFLTAPQTIPLKPRKAIVPVPSLRLSLFRRFPRTTSVIFQWNTFGSFSPSWEHAVNPIHQNLFGSILYVDLPRRSLIFGESSMPQMSQYHSKRIHTCTTASQRMNRTQTYKHRNDPTCTWKRT